MAREISLTQGKVALVDDEDFDAISAFKWSAHKAQGDRGDCCWYAERSISTWRNGVRFPTKVQMHRFILGLANGEPTQGEHVDGDGLNNQRFNLRRCPGNSLNQANRTRLSPSKTSRFRGVTFHARTSKWQAAICVRNRRKYLGLFSSESDAAEAYDRAAVAEFGEFARPNFPERIAS